MTTGGLPWPRRLASVRRNVPCSAAVAQLLTNVLVFDPSGIGALLGTSLASNAL